MGLNHSASLLAKKIAAHIPALEPVLTLVGESRLFTKNRDMAMLPWQDVPIIINSFNRYTSLARVVDWLIWAGQRNIIIIDNASTYAPLLSYLSKIDGDRGVRVVHLGGNFGHKALWKCNVLTRLRITSEFVYTDPDVVPSPYCPKDLVRTLQAVLRDNSEIAKAGPALRLDDIPDHYRYKAEAIQWEKKFWLRPAARGMFFAQIDTTFALYRPHSDHELRGTAIRMGWPYMASHEGWFINHDQPTAEDEHYFACARSEVSTWTFDNASSNSPQKWTLENSAKELMILNLGCGNDIIPGYLNLDSMPRAGVDIAFDLDSCGTSQIPLRDSVIDGFYACHVMEHVRHTLQLMQELHRIAKPGAKMIIRVPYGSTNDSAEDPTHVRSLFENSFSYFSQPAYSRADYGYMGDWEVERVILVVSRTFEKLPAWVARSAIRRARNIVHEMIVHLRAVKPVRPRHFDLHHYVQPEIVFSRFDIHSNFINASEAGSLGDRGD